MLVNFKQIFVDDNDNIVAFPVLVNTETISCVYQSTENPNNSVLVLTNGSTLLVNETYYEVQERLSNKKFNSSGWVLCSDILPDDDDDYLVSVDSGRPGDYFVDLDSYKNGQWKSYGKKVYAWMMLPEAFCP